MIGNKPHIWLEWKDQWICRWPVDRTRDEHMGWGPTPQVAYLMWLHKEKMKELNRVD